MTLRVRGLVVRRGGREVLCGVDLDVAAGERVAVLGASGAGKTSLLLALAGVEPPAAGSVRAGDVGAGAVALVPQGNALVALLTATENVELALQARALDRAQVRARAAQALADVGLGERSGHLVDELSGGEQQRVAVARALAVQPQVLLADEPTSQLDAENRARVLAALAAAARAGAAVVLTTHDEQVAARCERVLHLCAGRLA